LLGQKIASKLNKEVDLIDLHAASTVMQVQNLAPWESNLL